jgi:hypothetical protein
MNSLQNENEIQFQNFNLWKFLKVKLKIVTNILDIGLGDCATKDDKEIDKN